MDKSKKKLQHITLILFALIFTIISIILLLNQVKNVTLEKTINTNVYYNDIENCAQKNDVTCVLEKTLQLGRDQGPAEGLKTIQKILQENTKIQEGCHLLAHNIGKNYYENFRDNAIVKGHEWCSWGYYHGLMQAQSNIGINDLIDYAYKLCDEVAQQPAIECMHGVGHAAYTKLGNIEQSLYICEQLEDMHAHTCADGVIMEEIFLSEKGEITSGFTPENCLQYKNSKVVGGCSQGLTLDMIKKNKNLQETCNIFTRNAKNSCIRGYGHSLAGIDTTTKEKLPLEILQSCQEERECAIGYGWTAYMHYLDLNKAERKCKETFTKKNYQECYDSVVDASQNETLK